MSRQYSSNLATTQREIRRHVDMLAGVIGERIVFRYGALEAAARYIEAVMVTDTAFFRNRHYHQRTDTPDKLDYPRMAKVVTGVAGVMQRLAGA